MIGANVPALQTEDFTRIREVRASAPEKIAEALANRQQREVPTSGNLFIVAADHPARGALAVGGNPSAMADRYDLLNRLAYALRHPGVDGVLATPDIIDDLALLGLLENKIVVGSLNRGGLYRSSFEMDDRVTAYDIPAIVRDRLDFAKTLLRINLGDTGSLDTMIANRDAVNAAAAAKVPIMLEPFMTARAGNKFVNELTAESAIQAISIASALGTSSAYTWLKLPPVDNMEAVMRSTTLPTFILGGDTGETPEQLYGRWEHALTLPGVRGLVVGRSLLYPQTDDIATAIDRAAALVHGDGF
ncbi:MAG TPA: deoxyribose-phosphate aldolase [Beutenbergiaceae bacterium]|nr:deoxyribose-phosphate aldolase [Beutenbergiaceae bacterium]